MWYVIGAVIVGAALIFLMNGTFPSLFANVGETFEDKVEQSTEMTDGIRPPAKGVVAIDPARFRTRAGASYAYDDQTGVSTVTILAGEVLGSFRGIYAPEGVVVKAGETVTISFDVYAEDAYPIIVDHNNVAPGLEGNDHRDAGATGLRFTTKPGEWISVETSYRANAAAPEYTEESTIAYNRPTSSDQPIVFQLRNIMYKVTP